MHDILHDTPELRAEATRRGMTPLFLGTDVHIARNTTAITNAQALILLGTDASHANKPVDGLCSIEQDPRTDKTHHRRSGMTHVTATQLAKDQKAYVILWSEVRNAKDPGTTIGRIIANITICRTCHVPVIFATGATRPREFLTVHDHAAFWRAMGVPDDLTRTNEERFARWVARARVRASPGYVGEGVTRH